MQNQEQQFDWTELKDIWINSSQTREIHITISEFLNEVKVKTSQFEKDAIKNDLAIIKSSLVKFKSNVSQFEKDSIKNDLTIITRLLKKFLNIFRRYDDN